MATDLETLVVAFEASTTKFTKQVEKMNRDFSRQMGQTERRAKQAQTSINASLAKIGKIGGMGKGVVGGAIGSLLGKISVDQIEKSVAALAEIGDVADRVGMTTDAIQKLRFAVEQTGGTAEEADAAIQRFAKEFGTAGSKVREIFEQAGVSIKGMNVEQAFEAYLDIIERTTAAQTKLAISAAGFGKAGGNTMVLVAEKGAKGFRELGDEAVRAGAVIDKGIVARTRELDDEIAKLRNSISGLGNALLAEFAGPALVSALRDLLSLMREISAFSARMKAVYEDIKATGMLRFTETGSYQSGVNRLKSQQNMGVPMPSTADLAGYYTGAGVPGPTPLGARGTPITIGKKAAPFAAGGLDTGGGAKTQSDYEREVEAIQEKIAALTDEAKTVGMTTSAAAAYTAQQELLRAAAADGTEATIAEKEAIAGLAANMGKATGELERLKLQLDAVNDAQKAFASEMSGAFEGLIVDGKSLNEVFVDVLNNLARMLIQASIAGTGPLAGIMGTASTTGGAGGLAGILATLAASGMAGGGSVKAGGAYLVGERGPELMVPKIAGTVIPNERLRAVERGSGSIVVSMPVSINAPGADPAQLMRVAAELSALKQDVPRQVRAGLGNVRGRRERV